MTICVAAMAQVPNYPTIVAATDRAITTGNQVYDGATQAKRHILTPQIVALSSGDVLDEAEVVTRARREIEQRQLQSVSDVAEVARGPSTGLRRLSPSRGDGEAIVVDSG